jgi:hypothetical protein
MKTWSGSLGKVPFFFADLAFYPKGEQNELSYHHQWEGDYDYASGGEEEPESK